MKTIKKVLAVTLLITMMLIGTAIPAQAVTPPIGAIEMIGEAMAMEMGIGAGLEFSSSSAAKSFSEGLYDYLKAEIDDLIMTASVIYTGVVGGYKLVANIGNDLWADVLDYVGLNYDEGDNTYLTSDNFPESDTWIPFDMRVNYTKDDSYVYYYLQYEEVHYSYTHCVSIYRLENGNYVFNGGNLGLGTSDIYVRRASDRLLVRYWNGTKWVELIMVIGLTSASIPVYVSTGVTGTAGIVDNSNHDLYNGQTGGRDIGLDVLPVPPSEANIPINDSLGFSIPEEIYDDAVGRTYEDVQAVPVQGTNVGALSEIEYPAVWEDSDNYRVNLMQVFPFCIPFDIISLFQAFAAEPVAPVVDYAFVVPSLGVNVPITVDLSIFDTVAAIVRNCELVAFALGLMFITYKVIKW